MGGGIADETSMPPLMCECFGSAAYGQPPSWVHTGLTASTVNVIQIKTQQAQPFITRTNVLTLALYMSHSGGSFGC